MIFYAGCEIKMLNPKTYEILEKIKEEINQKYGFHDGIPIINYGPC